MGNLNEAVRVGQSALGLGVFALRQYQPDETVGRVDGTLICDSAYESDYCVEIGDDVLLEPESPFRFLNHSCQPNCALVRVEYGDTADSVEPPELWVETVADIQPGQELTIDYAWPAEGAIPCGCGSPLCRGWVVAEEELGRLADGDPRGASVADVA